MTTDRGPSGLFETMLVRGGRVILGEAHFRRLDGAAASIGAPSVDEAAWESAVTGALRPNAADAYGMRCTWAPRNGAWSLTAESFPLPELTVSRQIHGRVVLLPPSIRRERPGIKSLEWLAAVRHLREMLPDGADEGLLTADGNEILEGTSTNVFALTGDGLVTPPLSAGILPGIVRGWAIDTALDEGVMVRFRPLTRSDLLAGSFLTSSLSGVSPIRRVDGERAEDLADGPFEMLAARFHALR